MIASSDTNLVSNLNRITMHGMDSKVANTMKVAEQMYVLPKTSNSLVPSAYRRHRGAIVIDRRRDVFGAICFPV